MPPRKTTSASQTTPSKSRKRLSSQTDDNQTPDLENQNQTPESTSDDDQVPTSSNSNDDDQVTDPVDADDEDKTEPAKQETSGRESIGDEPKGEIIRLGEPMKFSATKYKGFAIVDNDVYREFALRGTKRVAFQLVYTAGTSIPLSKLNETK